MFKSIKKNYEYFYFKICCLYLLFNEKEYKFDCYFSSVIVITFLNYLNFLAFSMVSEIFTGYGFAQIGHSKLTTLMPGYIFLAINYFIFIHKKRGEYIQKKFKKQTDAKRLKSTIFSWVYVVVSFILPAILIKMDPY